MKPEPDQTTNWMAPSTPMLSSAQEGPNVTGFFRTRHGIVGFWEWRSDKSITALHFITGGREHRAIYHRLFSDRYLKTLANRFAAQHHGGTDAS